MEGEGALFVVVAVKSKYPYIENHPDKIDGLVGMFF